MLGLCWGVNGGADHHRGCGSKAKEAFAKTESVLEMAELIGVSALELRASYMGIP
jgi:hypothetical protein